MIGLMWVLFQLLGLIRDDLSCDTVAELLFFRCGTWVGDSIYILVEWECVFSFVYREFVNIVLYLQNQPWK